MEVAPNLLVLHMSNDDILLSMFKQAQRCPLVNLSVLLLHDTQTLDLLLCALK